MVSVMNNVSGKLQENLESNLAAPADAAESAVTGLVARVRLMMVIAALTTALAIAAVVTVIGYRMFAAGTVTAADGVVTLPKGARVISTSASDGRLAVLIEVGGSSELRTFDIKTLKETGRLRFATEP
jgi:hypothetical protein